jgi:hypothetical protein
VYWLRRLIVLAVAVALVALVVSRCGSDAAPVVAPDDAPPSTTPASTPATATPTAPSTPTAGPTTAGATQASQVGLCTDDEIEVAVTVPRDQYPVGGPVPITFVIRPTGQDACRRDVGAAANSITITGEGRRIWVSDDCSPGGDPDVRVISRDEPYTSGVTWQGVVSRPGCPTGQAAAPAGEYGVVAANGDVSSSAESFTLG